MLREWKAASLRIIIAFDASRRRSRRAVACRRRARANEFSDFELYLMGLLPPSAVAPGIVVQGNPCSGCILPSSTITISDVIAVNGPRVPDASAAKKLFDVAVLVISRDRLLTDQMAVLEYFAARGEATTSLSYTSGFSRGTTKPFYVATRGLARVDLRLDHPPRRRAAR